MRRSAIKSEEGRDLPGDAPMDGSHLLKRSLRILGHATSISLEEAFWRELKAIAARRETSVAAMAADIDQTRGPSNLSSTLRVFVLKEVLAQRDCLQKTAQTSTDNPD